MTSKVFIDSNGDAEGNYTVVSMLRVGNESDEIQYVMQPVGYFQYNINTSTNDLPVRFALSAQLFRPLDVATQPDWRTFVICTVSAVVLIVAIGLVSR